MIATLVRSASRLLGSRPPAQPSREELLRREIRVTRAMYAQLRAETTSMHRELDGLDHADA